MLNKRFHNFAIRALAACFGLVWTQRPSTAFIAAAYNPVINQEDFVPEIDYKSFTLKPGTHQDTRKINPEDFITEINNKYFTLKTGMKFTYQNGGGTERVEITVTSETKELMGVTARGVRITEWRHGAVKEDTMDWYAQDKTGNVWSFGEAAFSDTVNDFRGRKFDWYAHYKTRNVWSFGEAINNFRGRKLVHRTGYWEAGVNGAKPAVIMPAHPWVGDTYRVAEDRRAVVATSKIITVPYGTFENCIQIRDMSRIDKEYKYYCPAAGFLVREETIRGALKLQLIGVSSVTTTTQSDSTEGCCGAAALPPSNVFSIPSKKSHGSLQPGCKSECPNPR